MRSLAPSVSIGTLTFGWASYQAMNWAFCVSVSAGAFGVSVMRAPAGRSCAGLLSAVQAADAPSASVRAGRMRIRPVIRPILLDFGAMTRCARLRHVALERLQIAVDDPVGVGAVEVDPGHRRRQWIGGQDVAIQGDRAGARLLPFADRAARHRKPIAALEQRI